MTRDTTRTSLAVLLLAVTAYTQPSIVCAQANPYSDSLLARIRSAAQSLPGPRPRELRYIGIGEGQRPLNTFLAVADTQRITTVFSVFQIRFADRWIMVDAGVDSSAIIQYVGATRRVGYSQARYDSVQLALRGADRIVLTHEHWDHASGVQRSPYFRQVAAKTLLTGAQVQSLLIPPAPAFIPMSADSASHFRNVDYDLIHPLAPGVVLIKAPGHTPGSQLVYVRLVDDREVLLIGDLAWMMAGVTSNLQKPERASEDMKEDRAAIQRELDWVRSIMKDGAVAVTPSHDKTRLDALVAAGLLHVGLDLRHD